MATAAYHQEVRAPAGVSGGSAERALSSLTRCASVPGRLVVLDGADPSSTSALLRELGRRVAATRTPLLGGARVNVIGGGQARGICGSGMIDLLAELSRHGLIDPSGKLDPGRCPADRLQQDPTGYIVVDADDSADGRPVVIDENDLQNLLRTKAAIYSACSLMLASVGLGFQEVSRVYVAGAFGRYLDLEQSIRIGLLPDLPRERFEYLGNASLAGAPK